MSAKQLTEALSHLQSIVAAFDEFGERALAADDLNDARPYLQALGETIEHAADFIDDANTWGRDAPGANP